MKKLLVVGVIVLFLGVAITPSINANVSKASIDSELVEITTEICGLNGDKHTVSLSKGDAEEVEQLFDSIRERLNATETREEAVEIFKESVVELDKYGLLGGLSVKQAQKLMTMSFSNSLDTKFIDRITPKDGENSQRNMFCLIAGKTTNTLSRRPAFIVFSYIQYYFFKLLPLIVQMILFNLWCFRSMFPNIIPISLAGFILFGMGVECEVGWYYKPAEGSIWSLGLLGKITWDNPRYGQFPRIWCEGWMFSYYHYYPGVIGFTGLAIRTLTDSKDIFFLGSAILINVGTEHP